MLVVVLIIGILAAIALPQYQKAVWKSRAAEVMTLARNVYRAQQAYFMEQGHFADSFDLLPIDFKSLTRATQNAVEMGVKDGYIKGNGEIFVWINQGESSNGRDHGVSGAVFGTGPYARCGFASWNQEGTNCDAFHAEGQLFCIEYTDETTGFCEKLFKGTLHTTCNEGRYYKMP